MVIEYLLVTFPEQRAVLADGAGVGFTNHILMLPGDEYNITLEGQQYAPASRSIALAATSMVKPMVISFDLVAPVATSRAVLAAFAASDLAPVPVRAAKSATPRKRASKPLAAQTAPRRAAGAKSATRMKKDA